MVVFTCNQCGESLKKNKVDQHSWKCRFNSITCIDCLKDFSMHSYSAHVECITEDQKYGGINYKQEEFKGKNKQNQWIQQIKNLINEKKFSNSVQNVLQSLVNYDNIPRKKAKFVNFVQNSFRIRDKELINNVWDIFESSIKNSKSNDNSSNGQNAVKRTIDEVETKTDQINNNTKIAKISNEEIDNSVTIQTKTEVPKMKKIIEEILNKHGSISIEKLRKKVLKRYRNVKLDSDSNYLNQKFDKTIKRKKFIIENDRVLLATLD